MTRRRIPDHVLDAVRERTDLVDLLGPYLDGGLKKAGKDYQGICPFHGGDSFNVIPKKGFWYCHGCERTGDAIDFLMSRGLTFVDAAAELARKLGLDIDADGAPPPNYDAAAAKRKREREREQERQKKGAEWAERGRELAARFEKAEAASPDHPYLRSKGITSAPGLRQEGENLLVPMRDATTDELLLMSIQTITPSGIKRYASGARAGGTRTVIGSEGFKQRHDAGENPRLFIAEGWATAATINVVTGDPCMCAFDCGNLMAVTKSTVERYPKATIVVCADNDRWSKNGKMRNAGVEHARAAAAAAGALLAIPDFEDMLPTEHPTDYNDLWQREGDEAVIKWLDPEMADQAVTVAEPVEDGDEPDSNTSQGAEASVAPESEAEEVSKAPIVDPGNPLATARQLVKDNYERDGQRILQSQRGDIRVWSGTHYPVIESDSFRASIYRYLEGSHVIKARKLLAFKPTPRRVNDVIDAVKAVGHLENEQSAPFWLDGRTDPSPNELIACANGLLHLPTRDLMPHSPSLFVTHALPFNYDPDAPDPGEWLRFLHSLWPDDQESIATLQEMFAYIISGQTRLQKIFLLVGPRRSGKGTIGRVVRQLLGTSNVVGPTLSSLSTNFGISPLVDRPLAIISDARLSGRTDQTVIVERLLSISGEDAQTVDRKYREPWNGQLPTRFLILTNELPRLTDTSGALAGRFVPLRLTQTFYGKEDAHLYERLVGELPGILRWALDGWERLRERGRFCLPTASLEMIEELDELTSPVGAFLRQVCVVEPGRTVSCDQLYRAWREWCQSQGRDHPGTAQSLGRDLGTVVPGLRTRRPRVDGTRVRMYEGLALGGAS